MPSTLIVEINDDGTLVLNAKNMIGSEKELVADLESLAKIVGGELKVEKHVPGAHHHHHGEDHHHNKVGG